MKRLILLFVMVGLLFTFTPSTALATHSGDGSVSATVTASFLSVTVTAQNLAYGNLDLDTVGNLPLGQIDDTASSTAFFVENTGTKTSDWTIVGATSTSWDIAASSSANVYAHRYGTSGDPAIGNPLSPVSLHQLSDLAVNVEATSTAITVYLELDMPSEDGSGGVEQSLPINITAIESP